MKTYKKGPNPDKISKALTTIAKGSTLLSPTKLQPNCAFFAINNQTVSMNAEAERVLIQLCNYLGELSIIREHHSSNHITQEVRLIIIDILNGDNIQSATRNLIATLTTLLDSFLAVVPVYGISFNGAKSIKIGKVTIEKFNAKRADFFSNSMHKVTEDKSPGFMLEIKKNNGKFITHWGQTNAVVSYKASHRSAATLAISIAEEELNALRLFTSFLGFNPDQCKFGMRGRIPIVCDNLSIYNESSDSFTSSFSRKGHANNLVLEKTNLKKIRKNVYFNKIKKLLSKEKYELNSLETRIINSINWLGKSFIELDHTTSFVYCAIALEAIFSRRSEGLTEHISLCTAKAVGAKNLQARAKLYKNIRDLYSLRSEIVHNGVYYVNESDVKYMRKATLYSLFYVLSKYGKISNDTDWHGHLKELKLR